MAIKRKSVMKVSKARSDVKGKAPVGKDERFTVVDPSRLGLDSKLLREYEETIHKVVDKGAIPGAASVVIHKGKVVQADAYGLADVEKGTPFSFDTYCRLYCATKPYISTAFFTLVEEGRASPDDRLDQYIPAFGKISVQLEGSDELVPPKRPILLKHLMCHSSGIAYAPDLGEKAEDDIAKGYQELQHDVQQKKIRSLKSFVDGLAKVPLCDHPGNSYYYGFSFDVLARVLEIITGKSLDKVLREQVFKPLGMEDTKWAVQPSEYHRLAACYAKKGTWKKLYGHIKGRKPCASRPTLHRIDGDSTRESHWVDGKQCSVLSGGGFMGYLYGGLVSTVADTTRFVRMIMNKGAMENGQRLLQRSTITAMEKNRLKKGLDPVSFLGNISVFREGTEYGMGGAACTYWSIDREDDVATVWFTQHVDMPEFSDLKGVDPKKADLWQVMHKAVLAAKKRSRSASPTSASKRARK
eukprot:TRINITY_DN82451_c0_g1_i1.p1 TRINITY_DN82451_c0_g1~~TRINITY_DN82451_c0_g1_i1.p1  ORF type:complete len:480 (+),score=109.36 TRINITY_DN82451_c0_g1_i1:36-1442(+)